MHESLRLYTICKMMKWSHLPVTGGLYAQHPKFMDDLLVIASLEGQAEKERQRKREQEQARKTGSQRSRRGRR